MTAASRNDNDATYKERDRAGVLRYAERSHLNVVKLALLIAGNQITS